MARFWITCPIPQREIRTQMLAGEKNRHHSEATGIEELDSRPEA